MSRRKVKPRLFIALDDLILFLMGKGEHTYRGLIRELKRWAQDEAR